MGPGTSSLRLALIGNGIDKSLGSGLSHDRRGQLVGLDVSYELFHAHRSSPTSRRSFSSSSPNAAIAASTSPCRSRPRPGGAPPNRIPAVVAMGVANTLLLGPDGPDARPQHRLHRFQVGVPPAIRHAAARLRRPARVPVGSARRRRPRSSISAPQRCGSSTSSRRGRIPWLGAARRNGRCRGLRWRVGGGGSRRRRRGRQRHAGRDVLPAGSPVDLGRHRRAAMGLRRDLFAGRNRADDPRPPKQGLQRISGFDLFIGQAIDAFEIFTGHRLRRRSSPTWSSMCGPPSGIAGSDEYLLRTNSTISATGMTETSTWPGPQAATRDRDRHRPLFDRAASSGSIGQVG